MNESELIERAQQGDNAAKTELLRLHAGFIMSLVRRHCRNSQDMGDYLSIAQMGFLHGVSRFDPSLGFKLLTYVANWVRQSLTRYRETDQLVKPAHNKRYRMRRRESLGDYDGSKLDDSRSMYDQQFASKVDSLNVAYCDDGEDMIYSISSSTPTPEEQSLENERLRILRDRLCGRNAREVATLLRGDKTLAEVGQRFRVSRERVRQVERDGIASMRRVYEKACQ